MNVGELSAVVAVLALVISIVSTIAANQSANAAVSAEQRARDAEAQAAKREIARTVALICGELDVTGKLCNSVELWIKSEAIAAGAFGGSRMDMVVEELTGYRRVMKEISDRAESFDAPSNQGDALALQIALDGDLIRVRSIKEDLYRRQELTAQRAQLNLARRAAVR